MNRSTSSSRMTRVLAALLVTTLASVGLTATAGSASAAARHEEGLRVTFTKWVVTQPASPPSFAGVLMKGVVGGAVGNGRYVGTVLSDDLSDPGYWHADVVYGFFGKRHAFAASLQVTENDTVNPATATLDGTVVAGWQYGAHVHGSYTVLDPCPIATPGNVFGTVCFQGYLVIAPRDD